MDLALTEAQELLRNAAADFIKNEAPKTAVRQIDENPTGFSPEMWRKMADLGWTGMLIPTEYGGGGRNLMDTAVLYEEMGRAALPSPHHSSAVACALIIIQGGSQEQKQRLLPPLASGQKIMALAFTEPEYGWGPGSVKMTASKSDGGFALTGTKLFVPDAQVADQLLVVARTSGGSNPDSGLTLFVVDRNAAGISTKTLSGFTGEKLNEITFNDVKVDASNVIGNADAGWSILEPALDKATVILCAYMSGASAQVLDISVEYSNNRVAFGTPIGRFQRVQDHLIDIVNGVDAARYTTYEAIWKLDENKPGATESVSVAKAVASESFYNLCDSAHHVHGGIGIDKDYGLYMYTKKSRSLYHYLGDPVYHKRRLAKLLEL